MNANRWAWAAVRGVAPAAALLLLPGLIRGIPPAPPASPYLLGALVAVALWLERRHNLRISFWRGVCIAAALWLATVTAAWRLETAWSAHPASAERRLDGAQHDISRHFARQTSRLDGLLDQAAAVAAQQEGEESAPQRWREAVLQTRLAEGDALALYDAEDLLVAWSGASVEPPARLLREPPAQGAAYASAPEGDDARLFAARQVADELVLVAERRISLSALTYGLLALGPAPQIGIEIPTRQQPDPALELYFSPGRPARPRAGGGREADRYFLLRAPDGSVLALGQAHDRRRGDIEEFISGRWRDIGAIGVAVLLLLVLRRVLIGFPALSGFGPLAGASALLWCSRWVLAAAEFPHLPLLKPLFDFRDYTSPLLRRQVASLFHAAESPAALSAWLDSPGHLFLTLATALAQVALLYAAAGTLRPLAAPSRTRRLCRQGLLLLGVVAAALALRALVSSLARDARPLLLEVDWSEPDPPALLLQASLLAGAASLALGLLALARWARAARSGPPATGWFAAPAFRGRLWLLGCLGVGAVTLAVYLLLYLETDVSRRELVSSHVLPQIENQEWRRRVVLTESLRRVLQEPELIEALRSPPREPDPALAYELWSRTELGALGYDSSLRVVDSRGRLISRFGLNIPEAFEADLQRSILAGPGPAEARVHLLRIDKPVLFTRRAVAAGDSMLGGVELVVSNDYDNTPVLFSPNPYTLLFRSPATLLTLSQFRGAPPHFIVYDAETLAPRFSSDPAPPPPLSASLAARLAQQEEPVWKSVPYGRSRLKLLYARRGDEVLAVGYRREKLIRLVAGWLQAWMQNLLLAVLLAAALALLIAPAGFRRALRTLRPMAAEPTFYRRLLTSLLLASLIPLLALTFFLEGMLGHEIREEVQRLGSSAMSVARSVVADFIAAGGGEEADLDDDLVYWLAQLIRQDIHIYQGAELIATSRRELFSSGLLPTRLHGDVYRDLLKERRPATLRQSSLGGQRFYEMSARLDSPLSAGADLIVSLPLGLQQSEVEGKLRDVRRAILLTSALLVLLLSILSYTVAARISRPLSDLARAAGRLASGDLEARVERPAEAELQALIQVFNRMAGAIRVQQEDLRARRDYIEKILLNATTGVVSFDSAGRIVTANPSACLLTGAPLAPGALLRTALLRTGLPSLGALIPEGASLEVTERREEVALPAGGDERRLRAVLVPLKDPHGPSGGLLLLEDITENVRSNRLRAWAEMAQRIAHEIKNPLTPIQLSAEHLRHVYQDQPAEFGPVLDECVRTITDQVRALRQIAREFSAYARIPELKLERIDLRQVVDETLAPYASALPPELRLERAWEERPFLVRADRGLLRRALANLIENSFEALNGRGAIRLAIDPVARNGRPGVRITVDDDGPGIDPSIQSRLFEPFFSTKGSGTGLGLAIARQAVEANGGEIGVETPSGGRGTRMVIHLPAAEDTAES